MKLIHRFGYFSVGLFFGIVLLFFFLSGKKTSCDYFPNARVLKELRTNTRTYSDEALLFSTQNGLDTAEISTILNNGDVDFHKSETERDSCRTYFVNGTGEADLKPLELKVQTCDTISTILQIKFFKEVK